MCFIFELNTFSLVFAARRRSVQQSQSCAAGGWGERGRLLTFAISGRLQPSFMSIKAIKRLRMWMEISMNYHISGRDWITPSVLPLALARSLTRSLTALDVFYLKFLWNSQIFKPFLGPCQSLSEVRNTPEGLSYGAFLFYWRVQCVTCIGI